MISDECPTYRERVIEVLELISSEEAQKSYQKEVPFVNVPDEILCMWFDDLRMPESLNNAGIVLSHTEKEELTKFSSLFDRASHLVKRPSEVTLENLIRNKDWQNLMSEASRLLVVLKSL